MFENKDKPEWDMVKRVLFVKLRSIGDSVLLTPTIALIKQSFPHIEIDVVFEDWVAPLFSEHPDINTVFSVSKKFSDRVALLRKIRKNRYDLAFNFHGGTTAGFLTSFSGAGTSVGSETYQYPFLYDIRARSAAAVLDKQVTHSCEQQAALLFEAGFEQQTVPETQLISNAASERVVKRILHSFGEEPDRERFAVIHPSAAYPTKTWAPEKFAAIVDFLTEKSYRPILLVARGELDIADSINAVAKSRALVINDLPLEHVPAITALAEVFIGNDSGIAHIAAATKTPSLVIFGSSNRTHWHPWTNSKYRVVFEEFECQPCPGDKCRVYGEPRCIQEIEVGKVKDALSQLLD